MSLQVPGWICGGRKTKNRHREPGQEGYVRSVSRTSTALINCLVQFFLKNNSHSSTQARIPQARFCVIIIIMQTTQKGQRQFGRGKSKCVFRFIPFRPLWHPFILSFGKKTSFLRDQEVYHLRKTQGHLEELQAQLQTCSAQATNGHTPLTRSTTTTKRWKNISQHLFSHDCRRAQRHQKPHKFLERCYTSAVRLPINVPYLISAAISRFAAISSFFRFSCVFPFLKPFPISCLSLPPCTPTAIPWTRVWDPEEIPRVELTPRVSRQTSLITK